MTDTKPSNVEREKRNIRATGFMLVAVFLYSMLPAFITWGEAHQAPFMYNAISTLCTGIGVAIFLIMFYRRQLLDREIWQAVCRNWRRWSMLGVLLGTFNYAVYAWSLKYIDVSVAAVLYETWPLWMILLTGKLYKGEDRYDNIGVFGWACILMGFFGLGFVILSQTGEVMLGKENMTWFHLFLGALLALIAAGMAALNGGCSLRWGTTVLKEVSQKSTDKDLAIFFILMPTLLARIPSVTIGASLGIWGGHNEIIEVDNMIIAAILGFLILAAGQILFRMANLITTKLETNALAYGIPVFSLMWLGILGYINVPRVDWLIIGATGVMSANALLNFKAEQRLAYQSLVVALWVCGVAVYFRPTLQAPMFYEIVTVATTMFILILSFRIDRLVRRTSSEDAITLEILKKTSLMSVDAQDQLGKIDEAKSPESLKDAYDEFKRALMEKCSGNSEKIADIMEQINNLAHSKQQGANFGEQAVLWILGGISALGLLVFVPEGINEQSNAGVFS